MRIRSLNGLGVVADGKRILKDGHQFDRLFPKPNYSDPVLSANGSNTDTLTRFIPDMVAKYNGDTLGIARMLRASTLRQTCKNIWDFLYDHVQYSLDEPHEEQIRRPARTWADRTKGVDCDCYTVFISSVLTNLGIPHVLRMSAYNKQRSYQHVYVVVPKAVSVAHRTDYYVIDPVLNSFDEEKPFLYKKDKSIGASLGSIAAFASQAASNPAVQQAAASAGQNLLQSISSGNFSLPWNSKRADASASLDNMTKTNDALRAMLENPQAYAGPQTRSSNSIVIVSVLISVAIAVALIALIKSKKKESKSE